MIVPFHRPVKEKRMACQDVNGLSVHTIGKVSSAWQLLGSDWTFRQRKRHSNNSFMGVWMPSRTSLRGTFHFLLMLYVALSCNVTFRFADPICKSLEGVIYIFIVNAEYRHSYPSDTRTLYILVCFTETKINCNRIRMTTDSKHSWRRRRAPKLRISSYKHERCLLLIISLIGTESRKKKIFAKVCRERRGKTATVLI